METECPYIKPCPMFKLFTLETTKQYYINLFCRGPYQQCARFKLRQKEIKVPDSLMPDGQELLES